MAVYTPLTTRQLAGLIAHYDVGDLVSAKGIAEGISNSNWLIETTRARFVLTMYEKRIDDADLPFFLGLLNHLCARNCPVPATIHDRTGAAFRSIGGKTVALIEYLPGTSPDTPNPAEARSVGEALARIHLAAMDYNGDRPNPLSPAHSLSIMTRGAADWGNNQGLNLDVLLRQAADVVECWPQTLPTSIVHTDLFPDNVLMLGDRVTGLIDFYFAARDMMAYDLAVTHAAWCFDTSGTRFDAAVSRALLTGYEQIRPLSEAERAALPILAQGACVRFVASRAEDWGDTPAGAKVLRKDPMDFVRRWDFYAAQGDTAFA